MQLFPCRQLSNSFLGRIVGGGHRVQLQSSNASINRGRGCRRSRADTRVRRHRNIANASVLLTGGEPPRRPRVSNSQRAERHQRTTVTPSIGGGASLTTSISSVANSSHPSLSDTFSERSAIKQHLNTYEGKAEGRRDAQSLHTCESQSDIDSLVILLTWCG